MHEPIKGHVDQALPNFQGACKPLLEEARVYSRLGIEREKARRNQWMAIEEEGAQRRSVAALQTNDAARRQALGLRRHVDLVRKCPGVTELDSSLRLRLQPDDGTILQLFCHGGEDSLSRRPVQNSRQETIAAESGKKGREKHRKHHCLGGAILEVADQDTQQGGTAHL